MMIKKKTIIEVNRGDRVYELFCPDQTILGELHDVLMEMKGYCVERMVAAQKEEQTIADELMKQN